MNGNNNGIIQKVFSKYFNEESPNLCDIQQELIQEIKKTIPNSCAKFANAGGDIFYSDGEEEILRLLIGDNQD